MAKNKSVSTARQTGPGKSGVKSLPENINLHFLDKQIVQVGLGSNKSNKTSKVGK